MRKQLKIVVAFILIILLQSNAYAWLDRGHMIVAQIAYLRLTPAAKGHVDRLLQPPPDRRGHLSICIRYWDFNTPCERTYDPITVAAWMDDAVTAA